MKLYRKSKGNAVTEFSVLMLLLVPAFLAMPMLGKIGNVSQTSVQASRYAVWERTVSSSGDKSSDALHAEVVNRFFARPDLPIVSGDGIVAEEQRVNHFWSGYRSLDDSPTALVDDAATDVYFAVSNKSMPSNIGGNLFSEALSNVGNAMDNMIPDAKWGLEKKGLIESHVGVAVQSNHLVGQGSDCTNSASDSVLGCARGRNVMFVDTWESGSPAQAEERVRSLVPAGVLRPIIDGVSYAGYVPIFKELRDLKGIMGHVDEDVLPLDRYGEL